MATAIVKVGHSTLRPGSKKILNLERDFDTLVPDPVVLTLGFGTGQHYLSNSWQVFHPPDYTT